jgi:hypothetical protein
MTTNPREQGKIVPGRVGEVKVWDAQTGQELVNVTAGGLVNSLNG